MQADIPIQPNESDEVRALRQLAQIGGWCVTHTTDGRHAENSLHKIKATNGYGRAVDLAAREASGWDTEALLRINEQVLQLLPLSMISELIYAGLGGICVKNGRMVDGQTVYGPIVLAAHHDHVHLAVIAGFTYNGGPPMAPADDPNRVNVNAPIVGIAVTPTGNGYYLVGADGGVFTFGDAKLFGTPIEYVKPDGREWLPKA